MDHEETIIFSSLTMESSEAENDEHDDGRAPREALNYSSDTGHNNSSEEAPSNPECGSYEQDVERSERSTRPGMKRDSAHLSDHKHFKGLCFGTRRELWQGHRKHYPRIVSILFQIVIPLSFLLGVAVLCGHFLADFESPQEYDQNDSILANRYKFELFDLEPVAERLANLPLDCFSAYLESKKVIPGGNFTYLDLVERHQTDDREGDGLNIEVFNKTDSFVESEQTYEVELLTLIDALGEGLADFQDHMIKCNKVADLYVNLVLSLERNVVLKLVTEDLSFDWIRCWNETELGGQNPFHATADQIDAATRQAEFYTRLWSEDLSRLIQSQKSESRISDKFLNATESLLRAIDEASGRSGCSINDGGSAWFWFTILTTIGYGNQAPVTQYGRLLVGTMGTLSILLFAQILVCAGRILVLLVDDAVQRCHLKILTRPLVSFFLWVGVAIASVFFLSNRAFLFWTDRPVDSEVSKWESVWWAYITTTTVGLGDYFLPPEVIFMADVFRFALLILTVFVIWSMSIRRLSEVVNSEQSSKLFEERLKQTNMFNFASARARYDDFREDVERMIFLMKVEDPALHEVEERETILQKLLEMTVEERVRLEKPQIRSEYS